MLSAADTLRIKPYLPLLNSQFSTVRPLLSSGPALHLVYATGRRNLISLHTTITLWPIHDVMTFLVHIGKALFEPTYDSSESLVFEATLGRGENGQQGEGPGVWAVVDKNAMRETRKKRWDLTFPRMQDNAAVPVTHAMFTEHAEVNDLLFKTPNVGLTDLLYNDTAASVLKYLLITDQPAREPIKGPLPAKLKSRQIVLAVNRPTSPKQEEAVAAWLQVTLNIADLLGKTGSVKPEVTRKLAATRKQVDDDLVRAYKRERLENAPAEETAEDRRAAKKREQRAAMSEKELQKREELDKKRELRKMQKRQARA